MTNPIFLTEKSIDQNTEQKYSSIIKIFDCLNDDLSNIHVLLNVLKEVIDNYDKIQKIQTKNVKIFRKKLLQKNDNIYKYFKRYKYPELFHKLILNINPKDDEIYYNILKQQQLQHDDIICHLHCHNLDNFYDIYNSYIYLLQKYFKIIITFSKGDPYLIKNFKCNLLKIENRGMDIGAKMVVVNFLKSKNLKYKYIFMLHSKKDKKKREQYFNSFFVNIDKILKLVKNTNDIGAIVPDIIHGNLFRNAFGINQLYINQMSEYLNLPVYNSIFPEGNCYFIHKEIAELLYGNKLFYNILNTNKTFSFNWVKLFYRLNNSNIDFIYNKYLNENFFLNHLNSNLGYNGLPDGMIEHVFERLIFSACIKKFKKIYIIDKNDKELEYINKVLRFDSYFYKNIYPDIRFLKTNKLMLDHYIKYGEGESRKCNMLEMKLYQTEIDKKIEKEEIFLNSQNKNSYLFEDMKPTINILIRTSNREKYFDQCIQSIMKQSYKNINIITCYDTKQSLKYLNKYDYLDNFKYFHVKTNSNEKYRYNLYCNELKSKVKDGYILFLDDDDYLCNKEGLKYLSQSLQKNTIYIWPFYRADKIIKPKNIFNIKLGEISTSAFLAHYSCYNNCVWSDEKNGDYKFIKKVIHTKKPNIKFVNYIITGIQMKNKIGNFGN